MCIMACHCVTDLGKCSNCAAQYSTVLGDTLKHSLAKLTTDADNDADDQGHKANNNIHRKIVQILHAVKMD